MRRIAPTVAVFFVLLMGGLAHAELVQRGDLRLKLEGGFTPQALPRDRAAPITVDLSGSVGTTSGERPPSLRRISFAVNRYGWVFSRGLPTCSPELLQATSTSEALSRCRGALVGHGVFRAYVTLSSSAPFPVEGKVLAFNSRSEGRPSILLHIYGSNPVKVSVVLNFKISHPQTGRFGTVFSTNIPSIASNLGYVTDISLSLDRRYRYAGQERSFFRARCAAPAGFPAALFTFVRGHFEFDNGQQLTTSLTRTCRVR